MSLEIRNFCKKFFQVKPHQKQSSKMFAKIRLYTPRVPLQVWKLTFSIFNSEKCFFPSFLVAATCVAEMQAATMYLNHGFSCTTVTWSPSYKHRFFTTRENRDILCILDQQSYKNINSRNYIFNLCGNCIIAACYGHFHSTQVACELAPKRKPTDVAVWYCIIIPGSERRGFLWIFLTKLNTKIIIVAVILFAI